HVGAQYVDVVDAADGNSPEGPAGGTAPQQAALALGGLVIFHIPQQFHDVAVGGADAVRGPVAVVAVAPAKPEFGPLQAAHGLVQCRRRRGPPGHVPHSCVMVFGNFEGVVVEVLIGPQVGGPAASPRAWGSGSPRGPVGR